MLRIKKLDIFIVKSFLMLFIGTFFICLFIFMMQFLWRYVDELVGKGLDMSVIAQFFFYSALTLVPISLPLAILLASLITFGNFGERYELLAMKAAGISLLKIMRPLAFTPLITFSDEPKIALLPGEVNTVYLKLPIFSLPFLPHERRILVVVSQFGRLFMNFSLVRFHPKEKEGNTA